MRLQSGSVVLGQILGTCFIITAFKHTTLLLLSLSKHAACESFSLASTSLCRCPNPLS